MNFKYYSCMEMDHAQIEAAAAKIAAALATSFMEPHKREYVSFSLASPVTGFGTGPPRVPQSSSG